MCIGSFTCVGSLMAVGTDLENLEDSWNFMLDLEFLA